MIRVRKSEEAPEALNRGYNNDEVRKQLLDNQEDKCYLCERQCNTDYQVEHLKSQINHPELAHAWNNLFISCSYCNQKKLNNYDDMLSPHKENVEEIIEHSMAGGKVLFESHRNDEATTSTIRLLTVLFNGKSGLRNLKEQRFFNELIEKLAPFNEAIDGYLYSNDAAEKEKYRSFIEDRLSIRSEYLAFKYHIIQSNATLRTTFGNLTVWNKHK
jgi:uncharacterized protein (TIGR02646 family)